MELCGELLLGRKAAGSRERERGEGSSHRRQGQNSYPLPQQAGGRPLQVQIH